MLKLHFPTMRRFSRSAFQIIQNARNSSASANIPVPEVIEKPSPIPSLKTGQEKEVNRTNTGLVAAAFATLKDEYVESSSQTEPVSNNLSVGATIEKDIKDAGDMDSLLGLVYKYQLSKRHALKVLSRLSDWSSTGKIKIGDFKADPRFISLCQSLGKSAPSNNNAQYSEDLSTILSITGDEEAAKLVSNLKISQMIKVMSVLGSKKRRSTPILRSLAFHISRSSDILNIKQCADLLYAMASLNFPDDVLLERICSDVQQTLEENKDKSAVVASISTSLGILKYKESQTLEALTQWFVNHADISRPQDVASLVITLANLHYTPALFSDLPQISVLDMIKASSWLDYAWSLCVLDRISEEQLSVALSDSFLETLKIGDEIPIPCQKKLANINSYASLIFKDYKGPLLKNDAFSTLSVSYSKDKLTFVTSVLETLKSLLSSENYIKKNCNSNMGFLYDAECVLDSKFHPHPIDAPSKSKGKKSLSKIAILALDYHDLCKQKPDPLGSIILYKKLLETKDYKVLFVPYNEFSIKEKLVTRVQYIEKKLKEIVKKV